MNFGAIIAGERILRLHFVPLRMTFVRRFMQLNSMLTYGDNHNDNLQCHENPRVRKAPGRDIRV